MSNLFTAHPNSVNETYLEHFIFALRFGFKMTLGGIAAIVHAIFPFLFVATAGKLCDELQEMRKNSPGRMSATSVVEGGKLPNDNLG